MRNVLLLVSTLFQASLCFGADAYPVRPVRVIVALTAGGGVDLTARVISQQLSEQLGKSFIVDNRAGGNGTIGYGLVAKATPDGYTLLLMDGSTTIVPGLFKSLPFDVGRDFAPISQIWSAPQALVVHPSLNVSTLKEFIALAQANPGKFNYGTSGTGSLIHLSIELFNRAAKVNLAHIPYKGGGDVMSAMLGGQIQMTIIAISNVLTHVNNGRMRALAVTTDGKRLPTLPDVPSMSEAGVSGMAIYQWYGLVGPAGMPKDVINKLHAEVVKALAVPSVNERFVGLAGEVVGSNPEQFSKHIRSELRRWAEAIKLAGVVPE